MVKTRYINTRKIQKKKGKRKVSSKLVRHSRSFITRLRKMNNGCMKGGKRDTECAICMEDIENGQPLQMGINCGHSFHETCIVDWCRSMNERNERCTCPSCRALFQIPVFPVWHAARSPEGPPPPPVQRPRREPEIIDLTNDTPPQSPQRPSQRSPPRSPSRSPPRRR